MRTHKEFCQDFLVQKPAHNPPLFFRNALSQTKTCGERPNNNPATSPHLPTTMLTRAPVSEFQIFTSLSHDPLATQLPS